MQRTSMTGSHTTNVLGFAVFAAMAVACADDSGSPAADDASSDTTGGTGTASESGEQSGETTESAESTESTDSTESTTSQGSGTSAEGTDEGESTGQTDLPPDLEGQWSSPCVPDGNGGSLSLDFDIGTDTWLLEYSTFADERCSTGFVEVEIEGPYELENPSASLQDVWDARFGFERKEVTPLSPEAVSFLESEQGCNASGFVEGQPFDIYTDGCPGLGQYPSSRCEADYDIVNVEGDELRFGARPADNNMCEPALRPTELGELVMTRG